MTDAETSERYAVILDSLREAGTPIPTNDVWIAASAMQHGLRLLTTDAHYRNVAQVIVDYLDPGPWSESWPGIVASPPPRLIATAVMRKARLLRRR